MCDICHSSPHLFRCPNRPPEIIGFCEGCQRDVYDDEPIVEINGAYFHEECAPLEEEYDDDEDETYEESGRHLQN